MKKTATTLTVAALLSLGIAGAHAEGEEPRMKVTAENTQEKARFVSNLLNKSVASKALTEGEAESQGALNDARALLEEAENLLGRGDVAAADERLNRAIGMVMGETRRISEDHVRGARSVEIYEARRESVEALLAAYGRVAEEKGQSGAAAAKMQAIRTALTEADALAGRGQHDMALPMIDQVYSEVTANVAALRDGDKLIKELKFENAEDEYIYEVDRSDSHFFLLKLTLAEGKAHPTMMPHIDKLRGEAQELRDKAEAMAGKGDHKGAIDVLNESTTLLIKALRIGGAYIPG